MTKIIKLTHSDVHTGLHLAVSNLIINKKQVSFFMNFLALKYYLKLLD